MECEFDAETPLTVGEMILLRRVLQEGDFIAALDLVVLRAKPTPSREELLMMGLPEFTALLKRLGPALARAGGVEPSIIPIPLAAGGYTCH